MDLATTSEEPPEEQRTGRGHLTRGVVVDLLRLIWSVVERVDVFGGPRGAPGHAGAGTGGKSDVVGGGREWEGVTSQKEEERRGPCAAVGTVTDSRKHKRHGGKDKKGV